MKKKQFTEAQLIKILSEAESGVTAPGSMPQAQQLHWQPLPVTIGITRIPRKVGERAADLSRRRALAPVWAIAAGRLRHGRPAPIRAGRAHRCSTRVRRAPKGNYIL
jgi:hypothetical protein